VRNSPEDDGFASIPPESHDAVSVAESSRERYWQVLRNRPFQLACLSIGCESIARYGLINWVPMHFLGAAWRENAGGLWITIALPFGMAVGALTAGLLADRWFPDNRSRLVLYFLGLAAVGALVLAALPGGHAAPGMVLLAVTGFLVYGPQATYWALCPEMVGRERASTAAGLMDAFAYGFAALGQVAIGRAVDVFHTTAAAFVAISVACVMGAVLILPVRKGHS
jgi:OPA family glycerol-3-phosphate transporter-like MFS transporter